MGVAITEFSVTDIDGTEYETVVDLHSEGADISALDFRNGLAISFSQDFDSSGREIFEANVGEDETPIRCTIH